MVLVDVPKINLSLGSCFRPRKEPEIFRYIARVGATAPTQEFCNRRDITVANEAPLNVNDSLDILNDHEFWSGLKNQTPFEETTEELLAGLHDFSDESPAISPPHVLVDTPKWLIEANELGRRHGPFSAAQICSIIRALNGATRSDDEAVR